MSDSIRSVEPRTEARRDSPGQQRVLWDESNVHDYARWRYDEVDGLVAKARETGRSLLTAQTVVLLAVFGVEAKAGIFGPERQDFIISALATISALGLLLGSAIAAGVSFWAEDTPSPPSPQVLVERLLDPDRGVVAVEASKSLAQAYEAGKAFLNKLHRRLRASIVCSALGLGAFIVLFLVIAAKYPALYSQVFGHRTP